MYSSYRCISRLDEAFRGRVEAKYVGLPKRKELVQQLRHYTSDGTYNLSRRDITKLASKMADLLFSCE